MKRALVLLAAAAAVVTAGGWALAATWHLSVGTGLYCSVGTATTVGCNPSLSPAGQLAAVVVMLAAIPVLAACFALVTGHHAGKRAGQHVAAAEKRIAEEADGRHVAMQKHVERLLAGHCADLKEHINTVVADGAARGGAGSNPAESGFGAEPEDRPVVPPPASAERIETRPKAAGRKPRREPGGM